MLEEVIEAMRKRLLVMHQWAGHDCAHVDHRIEGTALVVEDDFVEGLAGGLVPDKLVEDVVQGGVGDSVSIRLFIGRKMMSFLKGVTMLTTISFEVLCIV